MPKLYVLICLIILPKIVFSQLIGADFCANAKQTAFANAKKSEQFLKTEVSNIDVKYHKLELDINYDAKNIKGKTTSQFTIIANNTNLVSFNLNASLTTDSILFNNKKLKFSQAQNLLNIDLGQSFNSGTLVKVIIYYHGIPDTIGYGSFVFSNYNSSPVVATLSESFGAPTWWPCKDDLNDKIDSSDVWVTLPSKFVSVSNGKLQKIEVNKNGTSTYQWHNSYPIAHYLISLACSNYIKYETPFTFKGQTMPVEHYIYPDALASVQSSLDKTPNMLEFFSNTFGDYPFIKEKYGHATFENFNGGMEHQTISSMSVAALSETIIAHELAHQWFGDKITCKTWSDIFMNEAFASYAELLYAEYKYGKDTYMSKLNFYVSRAKTAAFPIFIPNPSDENQIFDYNTTYMKGAVVLHMLRGIIGDNNFFASLKDFQKSEYAFNVASIDNFRTSVEKTTEMDLKYFFDEWIQGVDFPKYQFSWLQNASNNVIIYVSQTKLNTTPNKFSMPIQFQLVFDDNSTKLITQKIENLTNTISLTDINKKVINVIFDPNNLVLKEVNSSNILGTEQTPDNVFTIFPNPANDIINFKTNLENISEISLLSMDGKLIKTLKSEPKSFSVTELSSGHYLLKITHSKGIFTQNFIKK